MLKETEITNRINQSVVGSVFQEWVSRGLFEETQAYLATISPRNREPIVHSFITHVHKEKGLFVDLIGEETNVSPPLRQSLAMSADMLWALSLMVDDIQDGDSVRGGLPSCWVKYGAQLTQESVAVGLSSLIRYLSEKSGDDLVTRSCLQYANISLVSIAEHSTMTLDSPVGELLRNYERRCDFHGTFPLAYMMTQTADIGSKKMLGQSIAGLRLFNQGGQLINDLKDFVGGDLYHRSFSDIRRQVPTVPLKMLYDSMNKCDKSRFLSLYGKKYLTDSDRLDLENMVGSYQFLPRTIKYIESVYGQSLDLLKTQLSYSSFLWFAKWSEYKNDHIKKAVNYV